MSYLSSKAVKKTLREQIYGKLLRLGASYKEQVSTSEVVQVAVEGVAQLETYFGAYLPKFFYAMLAPLTLFIYLSFTSLPAAVVLLVCADDSGSYRGGADLGKEAALQILGAVYGTGGYFFGELAGLDHAEDLPIGHVQAGRNEPGGGEVSQNHHEGANHVSFTAKQGEVTALIGPSGGSKSTATKLAARFWDVENGRITVGGVDVSKVDPEQLLTAYSIVFQDVTLFSNTVMENIRIGRKDASDLTHYRSRARTAGGHY